MTENRIFLSHAGPDSAMARRIADYLRERGLKPILDREALGTGDSFIAFMEEALSTSDYCLLLWSAVAAARKWVKEEWQTALYKSVEENRSFLAVGRLDTHPLPALLRPRLFVELYPDIEPGVSTLVETWQDDRQAEESSERPVASAPGLAAPGREGEPIYVTSDLFGITCPWRANLDAPAGLLLDELRQHMNLPVSLDHQGRIGIRFEYHLTHDDERLERARTLTDQGVRRNSVLWIETETKLLAATDPQQGTLSTAVFRGTETSDVLQWARKQLLSRIGQAGLGVRGLPR